MKDARGERHEGGGGETARRREALARFYGPLEDSGDPSRRVGWESAAAHQLRLETIAWASGVDFETVLDAGCGEGALLEVLRRQGFRGAYRGEDLREAPIRVARERFAGDLAAGFEVADLCAAGPQASLVVCSGTFNTDTGHPDHAAEVVAALTALFSRATEALVFDVAVADRHHPGVGLAPSDLFSLFRWARGVAPAVTVHEDTVPGEAVFVLSRSRRRAWSRRAPDPLLVAESLVVAGEPDAALVVLATGEPGPGARRGAEAARAARIEGQALAALGRFAGAMAAFERAGAGGDPAEARRASLHKAPLLWRAGRRDEAEALLVALARHDDEARGHLFELHLARRQYDAARAVADRVGDSWMRRELLRILDDATARPDG